MPTSEVEAKTEREPERVAEPMRSKGSCGVNDSVEFGERMMPP
jgi:hypothetical protein